MSWTVQACPVNWVRRLLDCLGPACLGEAEQIDQDHLSDTEQRRRLCSAKRMDVVLSCCSSGSLKCKISI